MNDNTCRVVLAGLRGGSGKTTLSLGLIGALRKRGVTVAPFKKGPDYIDAGWLGKAAGRPCRNLDPFLMSSAVIEQSFLRGVRGAEIGLIEGNRGVFDGMDAAGSYSTAELGKMLKAPVVLVVDCTKSTRTVGALVLGCREFDPNVAWGGVVLNQVAGGRQEELVRRVIEQRTGLPVLGAVPRRDVLVGERHMGLTTHREAEGVEEALQAMGELVSRHVDLERFLEIARGAPGLSKTVTTGMEDDQRVVRTDCRIGVVNDRAFQFYYPENLEGLEVAGAELVRIDALSGMTIPEEIHALYVGGGFPEVQIEKIHENSDFRRTLFAAAEDGLPIYAECGGLMLLGRSIETERGRFEMSGVLPVDFRMGPKPAAHGYTVVRVERDNPMYEKGLVFRGHEFHYSSVVRVDADPAAFAFSMDRGRGISDGYDGLMRWNALGTYSHVHALGTPEWVDGMVRAAVQRKNNKKTF